MKKERIIKWVLVIVCLVLLIGLIFLVLKDKISNNKKFYFTTNTLNVEKGSIALIPYYLEDNSVIKWESSNKLVAEIDNNGKVTGVDYGTTTIKGIIYNDNEIIENECTINVYTGNINTNLSSVDIVDKDIFLSINEEKDVNYQIIPLNSYIYDIKWISSDNDIVEVLDGKLIGKKLGKSTVTLKINEKIESSIVVTVGNIVDDIILPSNDLWLKNGSSVIVNAIVDNGEDIHFSSSDTILDIKGKTITATGNGVGNVTVRSSNYEEKMRVFVNPKVGLVNGNGYIHGYVASNYKIPVRANETFFRNLVNNNMGSLSNNIYTFGEYRYDFKNSILSFNGGSVLMRFYYPIDTDLSKVNTFTFLGGIGEYNFLGYYSNIENNPSIIKSNGIVILVSVRDKSEEYSIDGVISSTNFVKAITKQRSNMRNAIGGYSKGGFSAARVADKGDYQKLMIFNSKFDNVLGLNNLMKKEIYIYSTVNDDMRNGTIETLNYMKKANYENVTIISNNPDIYNNYSDRYLVINPGSVMGSGHNSANITNSNYFMFGCV